MHENSFSSFLWNCFCSSSSCFELRVASSWCSISGGQQTTESFSDLCEPTTQYLCVSLVGRELQLAEKIHIQQIITKRYTISCRFLQTKWFPLWLTQKVVFAKLDICKTLSLDNMKLILQLPKRSRTQKLALCRLASMMCHSWFLILFTPLETVYKVSVGLNKIQPISSLVSHLLSFLSDNVYVYMASESIG